ncbi:unnamed protein product [Danaus chrysippus]|uniref:(African queen) hypothetical protein n=1 Tax=Danaus chrysippus TaxID=151541 RepID=A0A8J2WDF4_9NEOP|nr:unnamed protein product [Danaus chrysippus]
MYNQLQVQSSNETCPPEPSVDYEETVRTERDTRTGRARVGNHPILAKNYTCSREETGSLARGESVEACHRECPEGHEYLEPEKGTCCGHCVQTQYKLAVSGQTALHSLCENSTGQVVVTSSRQLCPDVSHCDPEDPRQRHLLPDMQGEATGSQQVCTKGGTAVRIRRGFGLIRVFMGRLGMCVNREPLKDFKECRGSCDSGTLYNNQTGSHDSSCECCQATRYEPVGCVWCPYSVRTAPSATTSGLARSLRLPAAALNYHPSSRVPRVDIYKLFCYYQFIIQPPKKFCYYLEYVPTPGYSHRGDIDYEIPAIYKQVSAHPPTP